MKQKLINADEFDVVTGWRKVMKWTQRAGACSKVKRRMRRRIRRDAMKEIMEQIDE